MSPGDEAFVYGRVYYATPSSICSHFGNFIETSENNETCITSNRDLAVALATDARGRMLFFSDYTRRVVYWARLIEGESIQRVSSGVGSVEGKTVITTHDGLSVRNTLHDQKILGSTPLLECCVLGQDALFPAVSFHLGIHNRKLKKSPNFGIKFRVHLSIKAIKTHKIT